jgi:hypothetical protein
MHGAGKPGWLAATACLPRWRKDDATDIETSPGSCGNCGRGHYAPGVAPPAVVVTAAGVVEAGVVAVGVVVVPAVVVVVVPAVGVA